MTAKRSKRSSALLGSLAALLVGGALGFGAHAGLHGDDANRSPRRSQTSTQANPGTPGATTGDLTLRGFVRGVDAKPGTGIEVEVTRTQPARGDKLPVQRIVSDESGGFEVSGLENHDYHVSVEAPHRVWVDGLASHVAAPGCTVEIELMPPDERTVEFVIASSAGAPERATLEFHSTLHREFATVTWKPGSRTRVPPGAQSVSVHAPPHPPTHRVLPTDLPATLSIPLAPALGVELVGLEESLEEGFEGRVLVYWRGAPDASPVDEVLLVDNGAHASFAPGPASLFPLPPGHYWIGVGRREGHLGWSRAVEVTTGVTRVTVDRVAPDRRDVIVVSLRGGCDPSADSYSFAVQDRTRQRYYETRARSIGDSRFELEIDSHVPYAIVDGEIDGDLELIVRGPGQRAILPLDAREIDVPLAPRVTYRLTIANASSNAALAAELVSLDAGLRLEPLRVSDWIDGQAPFEARLQPGRYALTITDRTSQVCVAHRTVTLEETDDRVDESIDLPPRFAIEVRLSEQYRTLRVLPLDHPGQAQRISARHAEVISTAPLLPGRYLIAADRDEEWRFMAIDLEGPLTIDFVPSRATALRLLRFPIPLDLDLRPGDELLAVDGIPIPELRSTRAPFAQLTQGHGRRRELLLRRDGREVTITEFPLRLEPLLRDAVWEPVLER